MCHYRTKRIRLRIRPKRRRVDIEARRRRGRCGHWRRCRRPGPAPVNVVRALRRVDADTRGGRSRPRLVASPERRDGLNGHSGFCGGSRQRSGLCRFCRGLSGGCCRCCGRGRGDGGLVRGDDGELERGIGSLAHRIGGLSGGSSSSSSGCGSDGFLLLSRDDGAVIIGCRVEDGVDADSACTSGGGVFSRLFPDLLLLLLVLG